MERRLWRSGVRWVAGVDEAGRGPLAGPVVAAAVIFPGELDLPEVRDSKQLTPAQRQRAYDRIVRCAVAYTLAACSPRVIERTDIRRAALTAMRQAILKLSIPPDHILVDGDSTPDLLPAPATAVVHGDELSRSVAAASILAKVTRDRLMTALDRLHPEYGFGRHKGYPTPQHLRALRQFGPTPHHRFTFSPIRQSGWVWAIL